MSIGGWSDWTISLAWAYGTAGVVVAFVFIAFGIERIMPAARGAYAFRPLLVPGLVMLWPVVIWRWRAHAGDA